MRLHGRWRKGQSMKEGPEPSFDAIVAAITDATNEMQAFTHYDVISWSGGSNYRRGIELVCAALRRIRRRGLVFLTIEDTDDSLAIDQFGRTWMPWLAVEAEERRTCDACGIKENDGWECEDDDDDEDIVRCQQCVEFVDLEYDTLSALLATAVAEFDDVLYSVTTWGEPERYDRAMDEFRSVLRRLHRATTLRLTRLNRRVAVDEQTVPWVAWRSLREHTRRMCEACHVKSNTGWKTRTRVRCSRCVVVLD